MAAVVAADGVAVQHCLRGEVDRLGGPVPTAEADAVGKGAGGGEDVARSAVVGNVLVTNDGRVVPTAKIAIVEALREVLYVR